MNATQVLIDALFDIRDNASAAISIVVQLCDMHGQKARLR